MIKVAAPKEDVPKTGDSSHMLLWIILAASMTVIGSGILVNEYVQKRNKK
ncbi:sortase B protein-sorting domain-containing protein [Anaerovoracaceae bacterium SGI.174]